MKRHERRASHWDDEIVRTCGMVNRKKQGIKSLCGNKLSGTDDSVNYAGHGKHQAYQLAKRGKQMKRDWEYMLTSNVAKASGDSTTARASAGLPSWLATNWVSMNPSSGTPAASSGDGSDTMTEATATASITEAGIKNVILDCFNAGGEPDMILCPATIKQAISGLSSNAGPGYAIRNEIKSSGQATAVNAVDVYVNASVTTQ